MKETQTAVFDQAAAGWDKKKRRVRLAADISRAIARHIPLAGNMTALEYGCGTGLVGLALAPRLRHLTCADSSEGMLKVLQKKAAGKGLTNISTRLLDLSREEAGQQFDFIFCAMTLHHLKNTELVLTRFGHALAENGWLAIADLEQEDGSFHDDGAGFVHHGFERSVLTEQLIAAGFEKVKFFRAHTIVRRADDQEKNFPVFLATAVKAS